MMAKRKAAPKRKPSKRKPREIVPEPLDPFEAYGTSHPRNLSLMILSEFDDDNSRIMEWVEAFYAIDKSAGANKAQLVELLKSTGEKRDRLTADLLERYDLKRPSKGRPRLPLYHMTDDDKVLHSVSHAVEVLQDAGYSRTDAVTRIDAEVANAAVDDLVNVDGFLLRDAVKRVFAGRDIITESKLEDFRANRRRSTRKKK
jgi:hypothetical protein